MPPGSCVRISSSANAESSSQSAAATIRSGRIARFRSHAGPSAREFASDIGRSRAVRLNFRGCVPPAATGRNDPRVRDRSRRAKIRHRQFAQKQCGKSSLPLVAVATGGLYASTNPAIGLIVCRDSSMKTSLRDMYALAVRRCSDKHGADASPIKRIDAGCTIEPELQDALGGVKLKIPCRALRCDRIGLSLHRVVYDRRLCGQESGDRRGVRKINSRGVRVPQYASRHHERSIEVQPRADRNVHKKMRRANVAATLDPKQIKPLIDASARAKVIAKNVAAEELVLTQSR